MKCRCWAADVDTEGERMLTRAQQKAAARKFVKGMKVRFMGGSQRLDVRKGTLMLVEGLMRNRNRMYVRCRFGDRRNVAITPSRLVKA